jgi:DNA polymerase-1
MIRDGRSNMLLIIDGNNIAYRSFHTPQGSLTTKQGEPSGVMFGVLSSLRFYLETFPDVTRVVVPWDAGKAKWRKEIYPEYKANRSYGNDPEEKARFDGLFKQIDELNDFLPKINVQSIKVKGYEADDLIYALCKLYEGNIMVVTSDKDMLQLINERVSIFTPYKEKVIGVSNFYEETGVTREAYMGYRALLGDPSDNINGIPLIGEKTAKSLMDKWGNIDNILTATGDGKKELLKSARTRRIFEQQNLEILGRNNRIMNFKYAQFDPEVTEQLKALLTNKGQYSKAEVQKWIMRWQFVSILANYMSWIIPFRGLENAE